MKSDPTNRAANLLALVVVVVVVAVSLTNI